MRKGFISLLLAVSFGLGIVGFIAYQKEPLYHSQSYVFGTLVDITIYGESDAHASALTNHILKDFQQLHTQLHAWKITHDDQSDSLHRPGELFKLNMAFANNQKLTSVSPLLAGIISDATALSIKSQGLFNPAIGHLISTWGFQRDEFSAINIDAAQINQLVHAHPQMTDIILEGNTASSRNTEVKLDFGGYAKGYALDMAARYLRQHQVKNALINIGGNIIALGQHGKKPWRVGIQHPRKPAAIATLDLADGWAIGTSGDYQRYFIMDGKRYCHIIDPRTGYPVQHTQAVTVLIEPQPNTGVLSDVASKPIFIEKPENKAKAASLLGIKHYMVIDQTSKIWITKTMAQKIDWLDQGSKQHVTYITQH